MKGVCVETLSSLAICHSFFVLRLIRLRVFPGEELLPHFSAAALCRPSATEGGRAAELQERQGSRDALSVVAGRPLFRREYS